jgi:hypothetical protein
VLTTGSLAFAKAHKSTPTPVTHCAQVLNASGEYVLIGNLNCDSQGGITISASNIHLNTAGFGVNAIGAAATITDGISNVRIDGGGYLSGGSGLIIGKDHHILVRGLATIHGDPDFGSTETGVEIDGGTDVVVIGNHIDGVLGISGTVNNGAFSNNTVLGDSIGNDGIVLTGHGNVIRDNTITLSGASNGNTSISVTDRNLVQNNIIKEAGIGIDLTGDSNRVPGNTVAGDPNSPSPSKFGIDAESGAIHNVIERNTVTGNQFDMNESNGPPCRNVWRNNKFQTSSGAAACIH